MALETWASTARRVCVCSDAVSLGALSVSQQILSCVVSASSNALRRPRPTALPLRRATIALETWVLTARRFSMGSDNAVLCVLSVVGQVL